MTEAKSLLHAKVIGLKMLLFSLFKITKTLLGEK